MQITLGTKETKVAAFLKILNNLGNSQTRRRILFLPTNPRKTFQSALENLTDIESNNSMAHPYLTPSSLSCSSPRLPAPSWTLPLLPIPSISTSFQKFVQIQSTFLIIHSFILVGYHLPSSFLLLLIFFWGEGEDFPPNQQKQQHT